MNSSHKIILGIDPGYDRLGWAIGEIGSRAKTSSSQPTIPSSTQPTILSFGCIETDSKQKIGLRFKQISTDLAAICEQFQPNVLSIEKLYFTRNTKTAMQVSESRGIVFATCLPFVQTIVEFTPSSLKLAVTGTGNANKQAIEKMIRLQLKLPNESILDDVMDALGLILTYAVSQSTLQGNENHVIL
jgi:crossover junction endodeoxyribonuclease RuvC